jgi:hypothetical protein
VLTDASVASLGTGCYDELALFGANVHQ